MFVSTSFPTFRWRTLPARYGVHPAARTGAFVRPASPAVSGRWVDDAYELTADLPGVPEEAVAVSVAGRTLTIEVASDELSWNERIRLPQTLDPEQIAARYVNGRLTVTIARTARPAARTIAIDTTPSVAVEAGAATAELGTSADSDETAQAEATETSVTA